MRCATLFSGRGGLDGAMHAAGHTIAYQLEPDPDARAALAAAYPTAVQARPDRFAAAVAHS